MLQNYSLKVFKNFKIFKKKEKKDDVSLHC